MVVFTCNHCGDSLQKPRVEKHYIIACRTTKSLTCVDCFKDFKGEEYASHTKCVTEAQRYAAKGSTVNVVSKGEAKQASWVDLIKNIVLKDPNLPIQYLNHLNLVASPGNIPRKRQNFINFMRSSTGKRMSIQQIEDLWNVIEKHKEAFWQDKPKKNVQAPVDQSDKKTDEDKNNVSENTEVEINKSKAKKKKNNKKAVANDVINKQNESIEDDESSKKKKKLNNLGDIEVEKEIVNGKSKKQISIPEEQSAAPVHDSFDVQNSSTKQKKTKKKPDDLANEHVDVDSNKPIDSSGIKTAIITNTEGTNKKDYGTGFDQKNEAKPDSPIKKIKKNKKDKSFDEMNSSQADLIKTVVEGNGSDEVDSSSQAKPKKRKSAPDDCVPPVQDDSNSAQNGSAKKKKKSKKSLDNLGSIIMEVITNTETESKGLKIVADDFLLPVDNSNSLENGSAKKKKKSKKSLDNLGNTSMETNTNDENDSKRVKIVPDDCIPSVDNSNSLENGSAKKRKKSKKSLDNLGNISMEVNTNEEIGSEGLKIDDCIPPVDNSNSLENGSAKKKKKSKESLHNLGNVSIEINTNGKIDSEGVKIDDCIPPVDNSNSLENGSAKKKKKSKKSLDNLGNMSMEDITNSIWPVDNFCSLENDPAKKKKKSKKSLDNLGNKSVDDNTNHEIDSEGIKLVNFDGIETKTINNGEREYKKKDKKGKDDSFNVQNGSAKKKKNNKTPDETIEDVQDEDLNESSSKKKNNKNTSISNEEMNNSVLQDVTISLEEIILNILKLKQSVSLNKLEKKVAKVCQNSDKLQKKLRKTLNSMSNIEVTDDNVKLLLV